MRLRRPQAAKASSRQIAVHAVIAQRATQAANPERG